MASSEPILRMVVPGEILAEKYQIERVLGQGGMGVVVAARHLHLGTRVAIKCLLPSVVDNPDLVARFLREAQTASLIASEHVTRVLDVGTFGAGCPFIVMEYLDGRDLASLLRERGRIAVTDAVDYTLQACEALAVAHSAGIVHRDIKPANLFLTELPDGAPHLKILDFGISKKQSLEGDFSLTRTDSAIMGSPAYISPEQIRSQKKVDGRADIWSLGVSFFELLSGQLPFMAENLGGLIAAILADPPVPLRSIRPDVPPALEAVVHGCLEKQVGSRPANVAVLAQQLRPFGSARAAASVERTMGVVIRTTGGSLMSVQAMSGAVTRAPAAPAPPRSEEGTMTRPLGTLMASAAERAAERDSRPMLPSVPSPPWSATPAATATGGTMVYQQAAGTGPAVHPPAAAAPAVHPPAATGPAVHPPAATGPAVHPPAAAGPSAHPPAAAAPPVLPDRSVGSAPEGFPNAASAPMIGGQAAVTSNAWGQSATAPAPPPRRPFPLWIGIGAGLLVALAVSVLVIRGAIAPESSGPAASAGASPSSPATTPPEARPPERASAEPSAPATAAPATAEPAAAAEPSAAATVAAPAEPSGTASPAPSEKPPAPARPGSSTGAAKPRPGSDLNKLIQNRK